MTLTVNQILVICLILVLIGFVVVVAIMAVHAIELMKKTKALVGDGRTLVADSKKKIDLAEDRIIQAATSVISDTTPAIKALSSVAGGLTLLNLVKIVKRGLLGQGGFLSAIASRHERKKARKELKKSKKMVKKVNKQTKIETKAVQRNKKALKKARKAEAKAVRTGKKAEARAARAGRKAEVCDTA
jgi:hypothetical protein